MCVSGATDDCVRVCVCAFRLVREIIGCDDCLENINCLFIGNEKRNKCIFMSAERWAHSTIDDIRLNK